MRTSPPEVTGKRFCPYLTGYDWATALVPHLRIPPIFNRRGKQTGFTFPRERELCVLVCGEVTWRYLKMKRAWTVPLFFFFTNLIKSKQTTWNVNQLLMQA